MKRLFRISAIIAMLSVGLLYGCGREEGTAPPGASVESGQQAEPSATKEEKFSQIERAVAELEPTEGHSARGRVVFTPDESGSVMKVRVELSGLQPGKHGFHIHTTPDCAGDGSAAGGHFNPQDVAHGAPGEPPHHIGDMGNVTANADGEVSTTLTFEKLAFSGPDNILNRPVIVHGGADDLQSQPSGDAGPRVACGIIRHEREQLTGGGQERE